LVLTFSKLGNYGRLGNQLFQYAFLRAHARRLKTSFWCPSWDGEKIFDLGDELEKSEAPLHPMPLSYDQGREAGFSPDALTIKDGTEIQGFFQSELYYDSRPSLLRWYSFRDQIKREALAKFPGLDFSRVVSLSLRIDADYGNTREFFPLFGERYYKEALKFYPSGVKILIFADRPDLARGFFGFLRGEHDLIFVEGCSAGEQLYLMSICGHGNIITNSTFSWWGAYLNACDGSKVCVPAEWTRPGVPNPIHQIIPKSWIQVPSLHPVFDHFQFWRVRHPVATLIRLRNKVFGVRSA
jgi:Glycosyl transferase family 11